MKTHASENPLKRILQIGNWPPPLCGWSMGMVALRRELELRGWECAVMNLNENRRIKSSDYIDVQNGWDYFIKIFRAVRQGYAVHVRVNGESKKGYLLALAAMGLARAFGRMAFLTYTGGHQQSYFPAPRNSFRQRMFALLFRFPHRIYCNSEAVKKSLLTATSRRDRIEPIPHFSADYMQFTPAPLPAEVEAYLRRHDSVYFVYVCFRKEFALPLLCEAVRQFQRSFPKVGFLYVGVPARELEPMRLFLRNRGLQDSVCLMGSIPHDVFLTLLTRSLAYIRPPMTDGVSSSVLEALSLKVPVLASDNGTRPPGTMLWRDGDLEGLLALMKEAVENREKVVARIPDIPLEDNTRKLADSIEEQIGLTSEESDKALTQVSSGIR